MKLTKDLIDKLRKENPYFNRSGYWGWVDCCDKLEEIYDEAYKTTD